MAMIIPVLSFVSFLTSDFIIAPLPLNIICHLICCFVFFNNGISVEKLRKKAKKILSDNVPMYMDISITELKKEYFHWRNQLKIFTVIAMLCVIFCIFHTFFIYLVEI